MKFRVFLRIWREGGSAEVPPKITRCLSEAGAVKLDCWPLSTSDPENHGARRNSAAGRRKTGPRGGKTALLDVHCGQEKWDALSLESVSLMRSVSDWMKRWRFFCAEQWDTSLTALLVRRFVGKEVDWCDWPNVLFLLRSYWTWHTLHWQGGWGRGRVTYLWNALAY